MKVLLTLIVALGILPAPVSFERADGTSTAKDVEEYWNFIWITFKMFSNDFS